MSFAGIDGLFLCRPTYDATLTEPTSLKIVKDEHLDSRRLEGVAGVLITLFHTFIARRPAGYSPSLAQQPQTAETSATREDRRAWDARALKERCYGIQSVSRFNDIFAKVRPEIFLRSAVANTFFFRHGRTNWPINQTRHSTNSEVVRIGRILACTQR